MIPLQRIGCVCQSGSCCSLSLSKKITYGHNVIASAAGGLIKQLLVIKQLE
ncbi:hypothetical protein RintRC_3536 [Richelia intracellularis]|nr:hypothetical protein RintRC_3536 [Richelia intracellularis]